jgi:hypothetical protein
MPPSMKIAWPSWIFPGIPVPFWILYSSQIANYIKANKLQPATPQALAEAGMANTPVKMEAVAGLKTAHDQGFKGGNRIHLHFNDKIYFLTDQQWAQFSAKIVDSCRTKLAGMKTVDFATTVMLASAIQAKG